MLIACYRIFIFDTGDFLFIFYPELNVYIPYVYKYYQFSASR
jgi:hypothetical protein